MHSKQTQEKMLTNNKLKIEKHAIFSKEFI